MAKENEIPEIEIQRKCPRYDHYFNLLIGWPCNGCNYKGNYASKPNGRSNNTKRILETENGVKA